MAAGFSRHGGMGMAASVVMTLSLSISCTAELADVEGRPCQDDQCAVGYTCDPNSLLCVKLVNDDCGASGMTCPSDIVTGSVCTTVDSYVPCSNAVSDCSAGCRTCLGDLTWSQCVQSACAACVASCASYHGDSDLDGLGTLTDTVSGCSAPAGYVDNSDDCDDSNPHCGLDCTDTDQDGYCADQDCYDADGLCTDSCDGCSPSELFVTATNATTVQAGEAILLEISVGAFNLDIASNIDCTASRVTIFGPIDFDGASSVSNAGFAGSNQTSIGSSPTAPFDAASCSTQGDFLRFSAHNNTTVDLNPALDATGFTDLKLSFRGALATGASSSYNLSVHRCCGAGCIVTQAGSVPSAELTGASACSEHTIELGSTADNCSELSITIVSGNRLATAGVDDIVIDAALSVSVPAFESAGLYSASLTSPSSGPIDISCTWTNPVTNATLSDSISVTVQ